LTAELSPCKHAGFSLFQLYSALFLPPVQLYRKHVITEQPYIHQMVSLMEAAGVIPLPIFINGVEAHTVVSGRRQGRESARQGVS